MLKRILIVLLALIFLSGCTPASQSVVLKDTAEIAADAAGSASGVSDAPGGDVGGTGSASGKKDTAAGENSASEGSPTTSELAGSSGSAASSVSTADSSVQEDISSGQLFVYVCGAVEKAGVYELDENSRIVDAVEAAGGFAEGADRTYVNLAARVTDGMKLQIPTLEEASDSNLAKGIESFDSGSVAAASQYGVTGGSRGLVNINTATKEELKSLSGIGDSTADKIIRYREDNGGFGKIEDIMKVSGIKEKLFSKIRDNITV
jgi:competence protein ComEA